METRQQRGNKRKIVVSGTKRMEPAACRETLHSMAFGPQLGVGGRFLRGHGSNVCKLYDSTFGAHSSEPRFAGATSTSNHLRKVGRRRSASDGNKRSVKVSGSQPRTSMSSFSNTRRVLSLRAERLRNI